MPSGWALRREYEDLRAFGQKVCGVSLRADPDQISLIRIANLHEIENDNDLRDRNDHDPVSIRRPRPLGACQDVLSKPSIHAAIVEPSL